MKDFEFIAYIGTEVQGGAVKDAAVFGKREFAESEKEAEKLAEKWKGEVNALSVVVLRSGNGKPSVAPSVVAMV